MKIKVGVIGTGNMGLRHVRNYASISDVELVAVSEVNEKMGIEVAKKYKAKFYSSYEEMIATEKLDIVSICTPTQYHYQIAKFVMNNKINLLLEKPIALEYKHAIELINAAKKNKIKFHVGHIERFNPAVQKVKQMIDSGEIGDVIAIIVRRVGGFPAQITASNIAVDLSIHDIDIVNYLLGELPKEVFVNKRKNHISRREDSAEFFLKYKKSSAYLQANWITPVKIRKINITGMNGYLEMDYITQEIDFYKSNYKKFKRKYEKFSDYVLEFSDPDKINIKVAKKEPLREELLYFIDCVKNNRPTDAKFAADALKIALSS
jgi:UDP-N-acetylglucosamine 3-dehydrogenase